MTRRTPLSPDEYALATRLAWSNARAFARDPLLMQHAGYKTLADYINAKGEELEKRLQAWERS